MTQTRAPGRKTGTQAPSRLQFPRSVTLTGRGAVLALFAACFFSLLIAAWTGWSAFADVMFVMACGVVTCYTRVSGLRAVVVCPPLAFFAGSVLTQLITAPDTFSAATGILITLGSSTLWLFTGIRTLCHRPIVHARDPGGYQGPFGLKKGSGRRPGRGGQPERDLRSGRGNRGSMQS